MTDPSEATPKSSVESWVPATDIRFLGKLDAVEEVLSVSDLFLMPSAKESFGLAALEAMACEVPVISSDAGGLPELNIDGETGFVCAVGDTDAMTEKALYVLHPDRLSTFKKNALARAQNFDVSAIVPQYEALYQRVVATKQEKDDTIVS